MNKNSNTSKLIIVSFLMALEIVLTRLFSFFLPFLRLGIGFLPISIVGILYGPIWAGSAYALGDLLGMFLFPSGPYFPGFTLSAFITGVTYGLILHKKPLTWKRMFTASLIVCIGVNLILDTFWLYIIMENGVLGILPARIFKSCIMIFIQPILIHALWNRVISKINFLK